MLRFLHGRNGDFRLGNHRDSHGHRLSSLQQLRHDHGLRNDFLRIGSSTCARQCLFFASQRGTRCPSNPCGCSSDPSCSSSSCSSRFCQRRAEGLVFSMTSSQPSQRIKVGQIARPFFLVNRMPARRVRPISSGIVFQTVIATNQSRERQRPAVALCKRSSQSLHKHGRGIHVPANLSPALALRALTILESPLVNLKPDSYPGGNDLR